MAQVLQDKQVADLTFRQPIVINGGERSSDDLVNVRSSDTTRGNMNDPVDSYGGRSGGRGENGGSGSSSDSQDPVIPDGPRPIPNTDSPFTDNVWSPDANASPEDNLTSLSAWLYSLFNSDYTVDGSLLSGGTFAQILMTSLNAISRFANAVGYDDNARGALAEKVADFASSFIQAQFQVALSYQSWYLQQEYNSPVNQMNRLAQAGLSSAFIFGGFSSGNAQSAAAMPSMNGINSSGAAQIQQQQDAASQSLFGSIFGTAVQGVGSLISSGASAVLALAQAATIKAMRPLEVAKAGSDIVNNAATYEVLRKNVMEIQNNIFLRNFDSQISLESSMQNQLRQSVDTAQNQYLTAWQNHTSEETETQWETNVVDNNGNTRKFRMTSEQLQQYMNNGGKVSDTEYIEGSKSWGVNGNVHYDASGKAILPPAVVQGKVGASVGGHFDKTDKKGSSHSNETYHESGSSSGSSSTDYNEDGTSFHIGNSKFISVSVRKRIPLPEHRKYIQTTLDNYRKAVDEYNTYSSGARARLLHVLDNLHQNLSSYSASSLESIYRERVKSLFQPVVMQGD